jgi:hypothetical protein
MIFFHFLDIKILALTNLKKLQYFYEKDIIIIFTSIFFTNIIALLLTQKHS